MNPSQSFRRFFGRQPRGWLAAESVALVGVIGLMDYATGYEVAFFPLYSIPILVALWFDSTELAILISILSSFAWFCADVATGHVYSREWLRVWDSIVRLMFFSLVVFAGTALRRQLDATRARIELLERSQKLEREIIGISEREQQRIGRDLHDGLGQHLVAIGLAADSLKEALETESPRASKAVGQFAELLHDAVRAVRDLARGLSPVDKDEGGLESALEQLVSRASRLSSIPCSFTAQGFEGGGGQTQWMNLFRIAQEALNNALKHAKASAVRISLTESNGVLELSIADNGVGMDASRAGKGMGLNVMRYRARVVGGKLVLKANSPSGTVVCCVITPHGGEAALGALQ